MIRVLDQPKTDDPYAALDGVDWGHVSMFKLTPIFEMPLYVARATGVAIVTGHPIRWKDTLFTVSARDGRPIHHLTDLAGEISNSHFWMGRRCEEILE